VVISHGFELIRVFDLGGFGPDRFEVGGFGFVVELLPVIPTVQFVIEHLVEKEKLAFGLGGLAAFVRFAFAFGVEHRTDAGENRAEAVRIFGVENFWLEIFAQGGLDLFGAGLAV
jgi:hypothetical protein